MDARLKKVLKANTIHLTELVTQHSTRDEREKSILVESLLHLNFDFSRDNIKEAMAAQRHIDVFNGQYDIVPIIPVSDFASFFSEDGYYYFKFKTKNDCEDRPILKAYLKSEGFVWRPSVMAHAKKRTIGQNYDPKLFVNICLNRAEQDEKLKS